MKINIKGEEIELRFTFNAFIEYEKKFNEPLTLGVNEAMSLDKSLWFYYFVVLCSKKGWQTTSWLSKDEFDEWLNEDPVNNLRTLVEFVQNNMNLNNMLTDSDKKK